MESATERDARASVHQVPALSAKAQRTRETLAEAARFVFERDGFVDARIIDITAKAGVAYGTFYTYFESKEEIFRELAIRILADMTAPPFMPPSGDDPVERIDYGNRTYVAAYLRNAKYMATLEQLISFNPTIRQIRIDLRRPILERNIAAIRRWQAAGLADPELDTVYAANALGAMVDRFMYTWTVLDGDFELELAIKTLNRIWVQALGISTTYSGLEGGHQ